MGLIVNLLKTIKNAACLSAVAAALAACGGSATQTRMIEQSSDAKLLEAPTGSNYQYIVTMKASPTFGGDTSEKSTREKVAVKVARPYCPEAKVVGESTEEDRSAGLGPSKVYNLAVRC